MTHPRQYSPEEIKAALDALLEELPTLLSWFDRKALWLPGGHAELLQRVSLEALQSLESFTVQGELDDSLRRWLAGIGRIEYLTMAREAQRAALLVEDDLLEDARADGLTPSRGLSLEVAFASLIDCLMKLPESDRRIIVQVSVENTPLAKVASEHELSEDQVYRHVKRIKRLLRDCWGSTGAYRFVVEQR